MERTLKPGEAAEYLSVHVETIRRMARRGDIPSFKVGRDWRISESALKRWEETHSQGLKAVHVLAVDDDDALLRMIRNTIKRYRYRVSTASSGNQALEIIQRDTPDLVLLDLKMPGMSGPMTLKEIRKIDKNLPVIIITGYPDSDLMMEALSHSPFMVLTKPFDVKKMFEAVDLALNGARSKRVSLEGA
jgi:excisionase family DNA binding protein